MGDPLKNTVCYFFEREEDDGVIENLILILRMPFFENKFMNFITSEKIFLRMFELHLAGLITLRGLTLSIYGIHTCNNLFYLKTIKYSFPDMHY